MRRGPRARSSERAGRRVSREFDFEPLAAASIGQVHAAVSADGRDLAVKLQYPGVERSINADVDNLALLLRVTRLLPTELDLQQLAPVLKRELRREADYEREADSTERYGRLVGDDPAVLVPRVHRDLSTRRVLVTDRVRALPIEDLRSPEYPRETRDAVAENLLRLVFRELFEFRFVQTDPNFANYLYEPKQERVALLDFGSMGRFSKRFVACYRRLVVAAVERDARRVVALGAELGFLSGGESLDAREAFVGICDLVTEPLRVPGRYDFRDSDLSLRVRDLGIVAFTSRGLPQPPPELLFLHRKLGGSYLLLAHLGAVVDCHGVYEEIVA